MRISVDDTDPGFVELVKMRHAGLKPVVFLNGVRIPYVWMADTDSGEITAYVLGANGRPQIDPENACQAWRRTYRGVVRIETERFA